MNGVEAALACKAAAVNRAWIDACIDDYMRSNHLPKSERERIVKRVESGNIVFPKPHWVGVL